MPYFYKNQPVEPIEGQLFDTHWNCRLNVGGRQVIVSCVPGVDLFEHEASPTPETTTAEVIPLLPNNNPSTAVEPKAGDKLNINTANFSSIRKHMGGIGRSAPKKLIDNKPEGGYRDFAHLKELNSDLQINWELVESVVVFE